MQNFAEFVLKNLVETRADLFGENSHFLSFEPHNDGHFDWSNGHNSTALFGRITYKRDERTYLSEPLALKLSPTLVNFKQFSMLAFFNEIFFYTRIVPFFDSVRRITHLFPKYFDGLMQFSATTDRQVIIFENLQASGYLCSKKKAFLDYDHLVMMMRKLGEFHSYSYYMKKEATDLFEALTNSLSETNYTVLKRFPNLLTKIAVRGLTPLSKNSKYSSKLATLRNIINKAHEILQDILVNDKDSTISVLCHGDFLATNVLFKYDRGKPQNLKITDLASCRIASPIVDLAHVLYLNTDQRLRNAHWDDLINEYYTSLRDTFPNNNVPSKETILKEFKYKAVWGFFVASFFLPQIMAKDNETFGYRDLMPDEYRTALFESIPGEVLIDVLTIVGEDSATNALSDILKDMIDRGFL